MFDPDSRYAGIPTATWRAPDGREVPYKRRRFLPQGSKLALLSETSVRAGDRLDQIAAQTLGQPDLGWRIADANDAMSYEELENPGTTLRVPAPQLEIFEP